MPASAGDVRDAGSIPGSERSPGGGKSNLLQYSFLENSTDGGAWRVTVCGVAKSRTPLSTYTPRVTYSCHQGSWALMVVRIGCWLTCVFLSCFPGSYECGICGKKYKYYNCFQTHVRAHRGGWVCLGQSRGTPASPSPACCFHLDPSRVTSEHFLQWKWDPRRRGEASLTWGSTLGWGWGGEECTGRATRLLPAPHRPTSSQGALVPLGVMAPAEGTRVSPRELLTGQHPAGDGDTGDRKGGVCRSLSLTLAGRDERHEVKACQAAGNTGKALCPHPEWNSGIPGLAGSASPGPAFSASLPLGSGPSTVLSAHPLLLCYRH